MLFEKVFIINLKRRTDRRQNMIERIGRAGLRCPVEFVEAVDAKELPPDPGDAYRPYLQWEDPGSDNEWYQRPLKMGEIGCSLSHYRVWQQIQREKIERALILEDDAILSENFLSQCQLLHKEIPADWELLYLYRFRLPITLDQNISERVVIPGFSHCTVAYVVQRNAVEKMIESGFLHNLVPIDEFLPCLYSEEARADIKTLFRLRLKTYASNPDLVLQDDKQEMGSDTEASAFLETNGGVMRV